jgi:hypothetical protein
MFGMKSLTKFCLEPVSILSSTTAPPIMTTESAGTASPSFIAYKSPGTSSDTYYFSQAIFKEKFAIFGASKRFFASNFDDFGVFLLFFQPKLPSISYPA